MSLLPKIKIGVDNSRSKFHVPAVTHATSEIGYVLPTYSRSVIPNSLVRIGTRTGVRLSPLFVPTMGELEVRHYHTFMQYDKIWSPFDAFIARKPFTYPSGSVSVPTRCPSFCVGNLIRGLMSNASDFGVDALGKEFRGSLTCTLYDAQSGKMLSMSDLDHQFYNFDTVWKLLDYWYRSANGIGNALHDLNFGDDVPCAVPSLVRTSDDMLFKPVYNELEGKVLPTWAYSSVDPDPSDPWKKAFNLSFPTLDNCDFQCAIPCGYNNETHETYYLYACYNFNGPWKRLRSIFMGLGYCFNPFDTEYVTFFKILAFYRAYWSLFGVNRNTNFSDTFCARITSLISAYNGTYYPVDAYSEQATTISEYLYNFMEDLANCTYTTPVDYFSSSVTNTQQGLVDSPEIAFSGYMTGSGQALARATANATAYQQASNAISMKIAMRLLRFVNKYSVVGSKVSEILRARFGNMSVDDESSENVHRIGAVSTPVTIDAVYSNSETSDMPLGSYAGLGVGGKNNQSFTYETDNFGCFITITAVVPKMGYFQGMLRENSDGVTDANEFFNPEFDALAWQSVRYNELIADRQFQQKKTTSNSLISVGTDMGTFGAQPTYTHLKCAFNRAIGDISLPHMQDSMLPYTLDRFFPQRTDTFPVNEPWSFRAGTNGNTNRIFQVTSPTDDHVIMQIVFDVEMDAPMKSISSSYDTFDETTSHSIEVEHE